ncbi:hypothetical protein SPI_06721 [Niveomyces insectorum RCEF 264]|uniref:Uncharacterized protein n=1 Tax=Niveomyces insectorum RCEF 264 TaxID=1081102 RepID=A0A167RJ60_9HYPO|nr:hypothetical protein SPI_06721 [Niveomyces insectorum RCEF 264]
MSDYLSDYRTYAIVNAVLTGILIKPLVILWVFALCLARRRKDPVRCGVSWLKAALPLEALNLILSVATDATSLVEVDFELNYTPSDNIVNAVSQASDHLSVAAGYVEQIATIATIIAIVELGLAFLDVVDHTRKHGSPDGLVPASASAASASAPGSEKPSPARHHTLVRYATYGAVVVLFALAVGLFSLANSVYAKYFRVINHTDNYAETEAAYEKYNHDVLTLRDLGATFDILCFVISLALVGLGGVVMHTCRNAPQLHNSAVLFLVSTLVWFIRYLWHLIYNATWLLPKNSLGVPLAFNVVDPIFNVWTFFVVLVLLYVVSARKQQGLWTTSQPWMAPPPLQPAPGVYNYYYNPAGGPAAPPGPAPAYSYSPHPAQAYAQPQGTQVSYANQPPQELMQQHAEYPARPVELK